MGTVLYKTKSYKPYALIIAVLYILFAVALIPAITATVKYSDMLNTVRNEAVQDVNEAADKEDDEEKPAEVTISDHIPTDAEIADKSFVSKLFFVISAACLTAAIVLTIAQRGYSKQTLTVTSTNVEGYFRISANSVEWTSYEFHELEGAYYENTDVVIVIKGGSSIRFRRMHDADEAGEILQSVISRTRQMGNQNVHAAANAQTVQNVQ